MWPTMRFLAVKFKNQRPLISMHRLRERIVRQKPHILNVICSLPREFGHVIGNWPWVAMRFVKTSLASDFPDIPELAQSMLKTLCDQVSTLAERVVFYDIQINHHAKIDESAKRLRSVPSIRLITMSLLSPPSAIASNS